MAYAPVSLFTRIELAQQTSSHFRSDRLGIGAGFRSLCHFDAAFIKQLSKQHDRLAFGAGQRSDGNVTTRVDGPEEAAFRRDQSSGLGVIEGFNVFLRPPAGSRLDGQRTLRRGRNEPIRRQFDPVRRVDSESHQLSASETIVSIVLTGPSVQHNLRPGYLQFLDKPSRIKTGSSFTFSI